VQGGAVVGRLTGGAAELRPAAADPEPPPEERAREIFEQFRASIEDEF
jgi:hypothetical protein